MKPCDSTLERLLRQAAEEVLVSNGDRECLTVLVTGAGQWHLWFGGGDRPRTDREREALLGRVTGSGAGLSTVGDVEVVWGGTQIACCQVARPLTFPLGEWLAPARVRLGGGKVVGWLTPAPWKATKGDRLARAAITRC